MTGPGSPLERPLPVDPAPGVHPLRSRLATSTLLRRLGDAGWATASVDLAPAADKAAILDAFARGLCFPGWVGRNWDALDEALRDLSWWPANSRGRLLIVRGGDRATTGTAGDRAVLHDVLETAASRWSETDAPLVVLLRR